MSDAVAGSASPLPHDEEEPLAVVPSVQIDSSSSEDGGFSPVGELARDNGASPVDTVASPVDPFMETTSSIPETSTPHKDSSEDILHQPFNSHRARRLGSRKTPTPLTPTITDSDDSHSHSSLHRLDFTSVRKKLHITKDDITVYAVTFNMHEQDIPPSLHGFLMGDGIDVPTYNIYAIATQEGTMARRNWELKIQETLGPEYVLVHSHALMGIHLCILVQRDLVWHTSTVESTHVATKMGGMLRTKGGVGICLKVRGASFLFVDSHLAAHSVNVRQRNEDFHTICRGLTFSKYGVAAASSEQRDKYAHSLTLAHTHTTHTFSLSLSLSFLPPLTHSLSHSLFPSSLLPSSLLPSSLFPPVVFVIRQGFIKQCVDGAHGARVQRTSIAADVEFTS